MLHAEVDSLIKQGVDAIVSESNTLGIMRRGVSNFIRLAAGDDVEKESKKICSNSKVEEGSFYITNSGNLADIGIKKIYHAVISRYGILSSIYLVCDSVRKILRDATDNQKINSISIPGLGINVIEKNIVAINMARIVRNFCSNLDIYIMDFDKDFIKNVKKHLLIIGKNND